MSLIGLASLSEVKRRGWSQLAVDSWCCGPTCHGSDAYQGPYRVIAIEIQGRDDVSDSSSWRPSAEVSIVDYLRDMCLEIGEFQ
jgi:hypothetical protein